MIEQLSYINVDALLNTWAKRTDFSTVLATLVSAVRLKYGLSSDRKRRTRSVTDVKFAKEHMAQYLSSRGYISLCMSGETVAVLDCATEYPVALVDYTISEGTISMVVIGAAEEVAAVVEFVDSSFNALGSDISTVIDINDHGRLVFSSKYMTNDDAMVATQSFYPWLNVNLAEYYKAYMESDEAVLVMFGPPGTGKSTFLRSLIVYGNYKTWLAYNKKVVESPKLISEFYDSTAQIIGYEDIDNYLKSREDGNTLMASILNASEGVVKHKKKKIVFSTNLSSIDKIDPALLRVGRCFDILQFRELSPAEAEMAAYHASIPPKDWTKQTSWPLSQVLAKNNPAQQVINRFAKKVGFG